MITKFADDIFDVVILDRYKIPVTRHKAFQSETACEICGDPTEDHWFLDLDEMGFVVNCSRVEEH